MTQKFSKIIWGDGISAFDQGEGVILVTAAAGGGGGGGGIQFETSPQAGEWLYVETTDDSGAPNNYGIELYDKSPGSDVSVYIHSDNGEIDINAGDQLALTSGSNMLFFVGSALDLNINGKILADVFNDANWNVDGDWLINFANTAESFKISRGATIRFRVYGDGSIVMPSLPTSNPGGTGNVWNNGGVLNIT